MKEKINISTIKPGDRFSGTLWDKKNNALLPPYHSIHPLYLEEWLSESNFVLCDGEIVKNKDDLYGQELPGYMDKEVRHLLHIYYSSVSLLKTAYQTPSKLNLSYVQKIISPWISYTLTRANLSALIQVSRYSLFLLEDYFYIHSIDTMLLSMGIYKNLYPEISSSELTKLTSGALLSDIGMVLLSPHLKRTDDIYTEEQKQEIKKHTILGYSFLLTKLEFPQEISLPALQHHERPDGSGYPYNLKGDQLNTNSIIIMLADVFSSQIHNRSFKDSREPVEILKDFIQTMMPVFPDKFQPYISAFVSFTTIYPVTSILELSTGDIVIVIKTFSHAPTRPIVRVLMTADKQKCNTNIIIDLHNESYQHVTITGVYTQKMLEPLNI